MRADNFNVQIVNINKKRKVTLKVIINLYRQAKNSPVRNVYNSFQRKVIFSNIRNLFIWAKNFLAQNVNIRQLRKITCETQKSLQMGQKFPFPECEYQATQIQNNELKTLKLHNGS